MAITFPGTPTTLYDSVGQATATIARPSGVQDGDYLLVALRLQSGAAEVDWTPPSGWVRIGPDFVPKDNSSRAHSMFLHRVVNVASEPASYSFVKPITTASRQVAIMMIVRPSSPYTEIFELLNSRTYGGVQIITGTRRAWGSALPQVPGVGVLVFSAEHSVNIPHVPAVFPSGWTQHGPIVPGDAPVTTSRTSIGFLVRSYTQSPMADQDITWNPPASGHSAESVYLVEPINLEREANGSVTVSLNAEGSIVGQPIIRSAPGQVKLSTTADVKLVIRPGFPSVSKLLASHGATWAHRGGGLSWPEMSDFGFTQAALRGFGALEFSAQRTSDGWWFGLHDNSLDRTSGTTGMGPIATLSKANVQAHMNTLNAGDTPRPYMGLIEFLDKWTPTHVVIVDPKNALSYNEEFLDILDAHGGPEKIIWKWSGTGDTVGLAARAAAARGYETWGFFYADAGSPETGGTGAMAQHQANWTILGMVISAPPEVWKEAHSFGKPVVGHIANSQANYDLAILRGARNVQTSAVATVKPISNGELARGEVVLQGNAIQGQSQTRRGGGAIAARGQGEVNQLRMSREVVGRVEVTGAGGLPNREANWSSRSIGLRAFLITTQGLMPLNMVRGGQDV